MLPKNFDNFNFAKFYESAKLFASENGLEVTQSIVDIRGVQLQFCYSCSDSEQ